MKRVNIDRINLRLRGVSPQVARAAMPGLSHQIQQLLPQRGFRAAGSNRQINQISPGPIQIRSGLRAAELNHQIAKAIANSISPDSE